MTRGGGVVPCQAHNLETAVQIGPPEPRKMALTSTKRPVALLALWARGVS